MEELRECPVCGSIPNVNSLFITDCWVECTTCGAETEFYNTKEEAIKIWNERTSYDGE